jgi:hypothetical protein
MMESVCGGKVDAKVIRQVVHGSRSGSQSSAAKWVLTVTSTPAWLTSML